MNKEELYEINLEVESCLDAIQRQTVIKKQLLQCNSDNESNKAKLEALMAQLKKEERDVEKLNGMSLSNFYYSLINRKTERLDKEEVEVLTVKKEIDELKAYITEGEKEYVNLLEREQDETILQADYKLALSRKQRYIQEWLPNIWEQMEQADFVIQDHNRLLLEIQEAMTASGKVMVKIHDTLKALESAENWGTWDILGGGMITTMAKHGEIDKAQAIMQQLKYELRHLNNELEDVGQGINFNVEIDEFLSIADYLFDGLLVDISVQSKINNAQSQMKQLERKVQDIQATLRVGYRSNEEQINHQKIAIEQLMSSVV